MSTHVDRPCVGDEETYLRAVFGKHWDDVPRAQQDVLCDEMSEKMVEWFDSWPPDIYNLAFPKEECGMSQHVDEAAIAAEEERRSKVAAIEALEAARVKSEAHKEAMQRAYDDALVVQSACNLSGVVFSFAKHMETICDECREQGTDARNTHPVVRLFVTQLMWLAFHQMVDDHDLYSKAHQECVKNASPRVLAMLGITQQPELQPEEVPSSAVEEAV